jgi:arginine decarboxylase
LFEKPPTRFFLTAGRGEGATPLNAFDAALLDAGIGDTNLVRLSSILPPSAEEIEPAQLPKGALVPLAYGEMTSSGPGTIISASVAVGIPRDPMDAGLIMECSRIGGASECEEAVKEMVIDGMERIRGVKIKDMKVISATCEVKRVGAVFAAVVLCP